MSENQNLSIWEKVEKTDSKYTKEITAGNLKGKKSIQGHYFFLRATELFGPFGKGWGADIIEERFDETTALTFNSNMEPLEMGLVHTIRAVVWYKDDPSDETRYEMTAFGHTPYRYRGANASYTTVDAEAPKKSFTDAIKKGLSMLGVAADIFLGLHEDSEYMAELSEIFEIENSDDKAKTAEKLNENFEKLMQSNLGHMQKALSMNELEGIYKLSMTKANARQSAAWVDKLCQAYEVKKSQLNKDTEGMARTKKRLHEQNSTK